MAKEKPPTYDIEAFLKHNAMMTPEEYAAAKEKGRSMAAQAMILDPEARERVERAFGIDYCKARYPEVYKRLKRTK